MSYLDRRLSAPDSGDVFCNLSLDGLADTSDGRLIVDQAALADTLFYGEPLRSRFTGNRFQALALARQMLAARDLYKSVRDLLFAVEHRCDPEAPTTQEALRKVYLALALADGDQDRIDRENAS